MNKEAARFFLALERVLNSKHQLLPYLREQILKETEKVYLDIHDEEVKQYLRAKL